MEEKFAKNLRPLDRVLCPALNLNPANTPLDLYSSALSHFTSIPWCAELLLSAPNPAIPFVPQCFNPASASQDQFFGATLASPRALQHMLSFFHPLDDTHTRDPSRPIERVHTLYALGEGVAGYYGISHGGMIMAMADEAMGALHEINSALGKEARVFQTTSLTGGLETTFLKPVPVPGAVCVSAWMESTRGRKTAMRCEVRGSTGEVLAKMSSTWIAFRSSL